jgi:sensor histidine kinase YesM
LESTRRGKVTIEEEAQALDNYLTLEKLRFKDGLEFSIDVDEIIDGFDTEIPAMLIQPFVENAVKHGFAVDDNAAKISVQFKYVVGNFKSGETYTGTKITDFLLIEIKDNGKGIDRNIPNINAQNFIENPNPTTKSPTSDPKNPKYTEGSHFQEKTGVGIALSRQRLALHNGGKTSDDLKIDSIIGEEGQVLGTVVLIKIRVSNELDA